jgi:hypothetical protein
MSNPLIFFTESHGIVLIQLVLAQLIGDFVLQTDKMVKSKRFISWYMLLHIVLVFVTAALFTNLWKLSLAVAIAHWLVDSVKIELARRNVASELFRFVADQLIHIVLTILLWAYYFEIETPLLKSIGVPFVNYKMGLILLGYAFVIWPVSYLIRFATQSMVKAEANRSASSMDQQIHLDENTSTNHLKEEDKIENGGKRIGQYERAIILTFVLLQQYEAIGFLITGKSIIRFAQRNENLLSEYVLVGTMMSYAFSILVGVLVSWLISLAS